MKNSDKILRDKFNEFRPEVPPQLWTSVNSQASTLLKLNAITKSRNVYRLISYVLTGLLFTAGLFYWINTNSESKIVSSLNKTDTLFVSKNVILHDTVYVAQNTMVPVNINSSQIQKLIAKQAVLLAIIDAYKTKVSEMNTEVNSRVLFTNDRQQRHIYDANHLESIGFLEAEMKALEDVIKVAKIVDNSNNKYKNVEPFRWKENSFVQILGTKQFGKVIGLNTAAGDIHKFSATGMSVMGGMRLNKKITAKMGLNFSQMELEGDSGQEHLIFAEKNGNQYQYVYRSVLGNAIIPSQYLNNPASANSSINIEFLGKNKAGMISIPIQVNYDIIKGTHRTLSGYHDYNFYLGMGLNIQKPTFNKVVLEIEQDGYETSGIVIKDIKGVSNMAVGYSLQAGGVYNLRPHWSLVTEATFNRNATYHVNNEYYKSLPSSIWLNAGLQYKLK